MVSRGPVRVLDSSVTFTLKVTPHHAADVYRTLELSGASTFAQLHALIQRAFELDDDHLYAFFLTNRAWDRKEVVSADASDPWERDVRTVRLGSVGLKQGKKFLYLFDFGDELRHEIEVIATGRAQSGVQYPRVIESVGRAPSQYGYDEDDDDDGDEGVPLDEELVPIAGELEKVVGAYEERSYGAESESPRSLLHVRREVELARRLLDAIADRPQQLGAIEDHAGIVVDEWLLDLPFELLESGAPEGAVLLAAELEARFSGHNKDAADVHARVLARAGRVDEARAIAERLLARAESESDTDDLDSVADLFVVLGDDVRAEMLTRRVLEDGSTELLVVQTARARLAELLRKRGEDEEADELDEEMDEDDEALAASVAEQEQAFARDLAAIENRRASTTPVTVAPKPGRNDPCSCGSGKKYKKCCG